MHSDLEKDCHRIEQLGFTLAEATQLLTQLQQHLAARQAVDFVMTRLHCQACGIPLQRKTQTTRVLRTLFGAVDLTASGQDSARVMIALVSLSPDALVVLEGEVTATCRTGNCATQPYFSVDKAWAHEVLEREFGESHFL